MPYQTTMMPWACCKIGNWTQQAVASPAMTADASVRGPTPRRGKSYFTSQWECPIRGCRAALDTDEGATPMNQFVKTPVTLNEAGGTRMLTDEELDEVSGGGVTLVELAVLLTVAAVAGVLVGSYLKNGSSGNGNKPGDYPTGSN